MKKLIDLGISLEDLGKEAYLSSIKGPERYQMTEAERSFLAGAVLYAEPVNILEIGVNTGAGSLLMLEIIKTRQNARLTSIDIAEVTGFEHIPIGNDVIATYDLESAECHPQWTLITEKDPSEVIEEFTDAKFDFVVLDSGHFLPCESLNFLTVLPYLTEDAVMVMHDIGQQFLHYLPAFPRIMFGNKLLMDNIVAESKIFLQNSEYGFEGENPKASSNIVAIQFNNDTRKYIRNVFDGLYFPWGMRINEYLLGVMYKLFAKHYDKGMLNIFHCAIHANQSVINNNYMVGPNFEQCIYDIKQKTGGYNYILYGLLSSHGFIIYCNVTGAPRPYEVWDNYAEQKSWLGYSVVKPHFEDLPNNIAIVITTRAPKNKIEMIESIPHSFRSNIIVLEEYVGYKNLLKWW